MKQGRRKEVTHMTYEEILVWWKKQKIETKEDIYTILDNFKVLFSYHSG